MSNQDQVPGNLGTEGVKQAGKVLSDIVNHLKKHPDLLFGIAAMILAILGVVVISFNENKKWDDLLYFPYALLLFGLVMVLIGWLKGFQRPAVRPELAAAEIQAPKEIPSLGVPAAGRLGLLFDLSHGQGSWRSGSIFNLPLPENTLSALVLPPGESLPWDLHPVGKVSQFRESDLAQWRGLVLGMPYHQQMDEATIEAIAAWVRQGGRLVLLGYELGERHHRSNLNALSDRKFGLRFNSDIVAPHGWQPATEKPYGREIVFTEFDSSRHPVLKDVSRLTLRNACTLTTEPGSLSLVTLGKHRTSQEVNPAYTDGWTTSGRQQFQLLTGGEWFPVIAEAPQSLCGKGRVLAIGTWDFFGVESGFKNSDNYRFARNLLTWCLER